MNGKRKLIIKYITYSAEDTNHFLEVWKVADIKGCTSHHLSTVPC